MRQFFHGWRPKAGCVSLVFACAFLVVWMRTWVSADHIEIPLSEKSMLTVGSSRQLLGWVYETTDDPHGNVFDFGSDPADARIEEVIGIGGINSPLEVGAGYELKWKISCVGIVVGQSDYLVDFQSRFTFAVFPYWSIVIALSIVSAYLIWFKPRSLHDRKSTEPKSNESATMMADFFRAWRRKLGVVTLLLASVLAGAWTVSFWHPACFAELHYKHGEHDQDDLLYSLPNQIAWAQTRNVDASSPYNMSMSLSTGARPKYSSMVFEIPYQWRWKIAGFRYADGVEAEGSNVCSMLFVPYWSIVLPPTLFSAWLLWGTLRKKPLLKGL